MQKDCWEQSLPCTSEQSLPCSRPPSLDTYLLHLTAMGWLTVEHSLRNIRPFLFVIFLKTKECDIRATIHIG